jgi:hypothetical protein
MYNKAPESSPQWNIEMEHVVVTFSSRLTSLPRALRFTVVERRSLEESLALDPNEVVFYRILRPVVDSAKQVVSSRLRLFHGERVSPGGVGSVA